jgi:hypothetical protein
MKHFLLFLTILLLSACGKASSTNSEDGKVYAFNNGESIEYLTADDLREGITSDLIARMNQLNAQLPITIDEYTVMYSAVLNGTVINYNFQAYIDSELLTADDIKSFCEETKATALQNIQFLFEQNSDKLPVEDWARLYSELGIKYNYNYIDENKKVFAKVVIDPIDILE